MVDNKNKSADLSLRLNKSQNEVMKIRFFEANKILNPAIPIHRNEIIIEF